MKTERIVVAIALLVLLAAAFAGSRQTSHRPAAPTGVRIIEIR